MADIRSANVTNDLKVRPAFEADQSGSGNAAAQFLDTMMASIGGLSASPQTTEKAADKASDKTLENAPAPLSYAQRMRDAKTVERPDAPAKAAAPKEPKDIIQEKIQAKMAELAARNDTPVTDDRALKALKKLAAFLLNAQEQGKLDLPQTLTDRLEAFIAKLDQNGTDLKAADIALFLHDFAKIFRQMNMVVAAPAPVVAKPVDAPAEGDAVEKPSEKPVENTDDDVALVWPPEIVAAFAELKLSGHVKTDRPITALDVLKAVKTLVSVGEKAALQALRDSAQAALALQNEAQILIPVATVDKLTEKLGAVLPVTAETKAAIATLSQADAQNLVVKAAVVAAPLALKPERDMAATDTAQPATFGDTQTDPVDVLLDNLTPQNAKSDLRGETKPDLQQALKQQTAPAPQSGAAVMAAAIASAAKNADQNPGNMATAAIADATNALADNGADGANPLAPASANNGRFAKALNAAAQAQQNQPSSATQQVLVQIQNRAAKSSHINIQLSPAELGRVDVRLNIGRDGQAYAVVMADKPETLALLQRDAASLEKSLQNAGLNASAGNMSFNLREQRQQEQSGFSRGKRLGREEKTDAPAELALNVHSNGQIISDTRVNYHA